MLAQIYQRLQDASNEIGKNGAIVKHLLDKLEGKDDPPLQTSRGGKKKRREKKK